MLVFQHCNNTPRETSTSSMHMHFPRNASFQSGQWLINKHEMVLEGPRSKKRRNAVSSKFLLMERHVAAMDLRHHYSTIYSPPYTLHRLQTGSTSFWEAMRELHPGLWSLWQSSIPSFPPPRGASSCGCTEHLPASRGEMAPCLSSDEHQKGFWNLQAISHKVTVWLHTPLR